MSIRGMLTHDVWILKKDGQHELKVKANIQYEFGYFGPDTDIEVGDVVKVLASGEKRKVIEVHSILGRRNIVHHKKAKLS